MPLTDVNYTIATPPTKEDNAVLDTLSDILVAGVEGGIHGIAGWALVLDYQWEDEDTGVAPGRRIHATAVIREHNESSNPHDMGEPMELTPEVMLTGALRLINGDVQGDTGYYNVPLKDRLLAMLKGDWDDFDASDADIIIQAALFHDVVYG